MSSANPISTVSGQDSAQQYGFVDPSGASAAMQNTLYGNNGSGGLLGGGAMGTFNQNANNVVGQIAGYSGPLQQTLSNTANYQANNALNAVGSNFANMGALGSGAGAQAMGNAIAQPFAQAQAQLQNSQLNSAGNALSGLMNVSGNTYNTGLNQAGNLMEHTSGLVAPTMYSNPTAMQQALGKGQAQSLGMGAAASTAGNALGSAASGAVGSGKGAAATGPGTASVGAMPWYAAAA